MKKTVFLFSFITLALACSAQITSTFDTDADGWTALNGSTGDPVYFNTAGNPGGYLRITDGAPATATYFVAPSSYLGNKTMSYGQFLRFDLQTSAGTKSNAASGDIVLVSPSNNLFLNLSTLPATAPAWTSYALKLDETQNWRLSNIAGPVATKAEIRATLASLTGIRICGEYVTGPGDTGGIDNVVLEQRVLLPAPAITSFAPTLGKPGITVTINGNNFDPTPTNNTVSFGEFAGTKAVVQSATATRLDVVVPLGAVSGRITITNTITGLTSKTSIPFIPVFEGGGRIIPASFAPKFSIATIQNEGWFVGDIDGDGWEDFGVANNNTDNAVDIYRNLGLGGTLSTASFAAKVSTPIPPLATGGANGAGLWFADLDGDGKLDAISSNKMFIFGAAGFVTLRNISTPGSIAFEAPEYWVGGSDETSPALIVDIDGDGRPEMIGGEGSGSGLPTARNMWIIQNISTPGDIDFGASVRVSFLVDAFSAVSASDLDNDGKPELLVSWNFGDRFSIIKNNSTPGNISLTDIGTITTGQYNAALQGADFNLDGKNDLAWKRTSGEIYIRLNTNTGAPLALTDFTTEFILTSDLGAQGGISIADVNGDGKLDIVTTDNTDLGVYENIYAGGVFDASAFVPAYQVLGGGAYSPRISDLNHDTKPDFVLAGGASVTIAENKNIHAPVISLNTVSPLKGAVGSTVTITGNNFSLVPTENKVWFGGIEATVLSATANLITAQVPTGATYAPVSVTKDGLTSRYRLPFQTTFSAGVTFDNTHFAPPVNYTLTGAGYNIEAADLNNDGTVDIFASAGNVAYAFRNDFTTGAITTTTLIPNDTLSPVNDVFGNPRLEDFDGDGYFDVASVNTRIRKNITTGSNINFTPNITYAGQGNLAYADFNQDGKIDMAVANSGSAQLNLIENRTVPGNFITTGTYGSFSSSFGFGKLSAGGDLTTADFDADGFPDIVTTNPTTDNISIYRNLGNKRISATQFATRVDIAVGDNPSRIYKGDFDGDGKLDLVLYHSTGTSTTLLIVFQNTSTVGTISFSRIDLTNPSATTVAHVADLDGDGRPEILTTSEAGNRFSIFKNIHTSGALTTASFAAPFNTTVTAPRGITTGDLNLDGKPEIIITRAANLLVVYENLISSFPVPTITSFSPTSGPVGTSVSMTGTNFSTTPTDNIVAFNGTAAVVTSSTTTSIMTTVPVGAITGTITVTIAGITATSSSNFTVTTSPVISITTQPVSSAACVGEVRNFATAATGTTNITYQWQFGLTSTGTFTDINNGSGYSGVTTTSLSVNSTGNFGAGFYRCKINGDFAATVYSDAAQLTVNAIPTAPTITNGARCSTGSVTLSAAGGAVGQYRWYTTATGGSPITGETNSSYVTPPLTTTTSYFVSINNGLCESTRTSVSAAINSPPAIPTITSDITLVANAVTICSTTTLTLSAPTGFSAYSWSNGATTSQITVSASGTYSVIVTNALGCDSASSNAITVTVVAAPCNNAAPVINSTTSSTTIGGEATINLLDVISDADDNLVISSLRISQQPSSGAVATIINGMLSINYAGIAFSGKDQLTIEVCDVFNVCAQRVIEIDVIGDIEVYNGISPNGDNQNEIFLIKHIELFPETQSNKVTIYNRWGSPVFEVENYDNITNVFRGLNENGNELPSGTYFYKIIFASGRKTELGYVTLKR